MSFGETGERVDTAGTSGVEKTLVHRLPHAYAETAPVKPAPVATPSAARTSRTARAPQPRQTTPVSTRKPKRSSQWRRLLIPLALIVIVGSLTVIGLRLNLSTEAPRDGAGVAAPSAQWPVIAAQDFDPEGNGEEHPRQVTLAWDGNPDTSWTTMNYYESDIGNKTGVGLVFDFGEVRQLSRVELDLDGNGTSLEVRIPTAAAQGVKSAPLGSVDRWREVATVDRAPVATSINLEQPVQTRYVLIFLTELPRAGSEYTGGIGEARFAS